MATEIKIPKPKIVGMEVKIRNIAGSSMLHNRFTEAAGDSIKKTSTKAAKSGKPAININKAFEASQYRNEEGKLGVPAKAIKASMVNAAVIAGEKMTNMRKAFHVVGDILPFSKNSKPIISEEYLTNPTTRGKNLRVRAKIEKWELKVPIRFNENFVSAEQIINLLSLAGFHCGLMDYRPFSKSCSGNCGMFEVVNK